MDALFQLFATVSAAKITTMNNASMKRVAIHECVSIDALSVLIFEYAEPTLEDQTRYLIEQLSNYEHISVV